jgi:hypothetical protein
VAQVQTLELREVEEVDLVDEEAVVLEVRFREKNYCAKSNETDFE